MPFHSRKPTSARSRSSTSWQPVTKWYDKLVGDQGQEYHERLILPELFKHLQLSEDDALLDVGCGQGILARHISSTTKYVGVDASAGLISAAKKRDENRLHTYVLADATKPLKVKDNFSHAIFMLSLQNMENADQAIKNVAGKLRRNGKLILVLNHPAFRIPRQSSWGVDEKNKTQYRRIDRYRGFLKIPITAHPGKKSSPVTWSYHYSLEQLSTFLHESGFVIEHLKELYSGRVSEGKAAKMENRARGEFPLFLMIIATKK